MDSSVRRPGSGGSGEANDLKEKRLPHKREAPIPLQDVIVTLHYVAGQNRKVFETVQVCGGAMR